MDATVLNRQRKQAVDTAALRKAAETILTALAQTDAELTVTLVSDERMRALNRRFRGIDRATDVLSFAQDEGGDEDDEQAAVPLVPGAPQVLGDVVLSPETAARQAAEHAPPGLDGAAAVQRELTYLLLHGVLHLVGHTHDEDADHERMQSETRRIWPLVDAWSGGRNGADG